MDTNLDFSSLVELQKSWVNRVGYMNLGLCGLVLIAVAAVYVDFLSKFDCVC